MPNSPNYQMTIPESKKALRPSPNWSPLAIDTFNEVEGVNVADIYVDSKSPHGHRAIAFRDPK